MIIKTDGTKETIASFNLETLQEAVGGHLEALFIGNGIYLYLNEEGKLMGLPYNAVATSLASRSLQANDYIAGNVVVCGCDDFGNEVPLTPEQARLVENAG
jgi:hypothetical protein